MEATQLECGCAVRDGQMETRSGGGIVTGGSHRRGGHAVGHDAVDGTGPWPVRRPGPVAGAPRVHDPGKIIALGGAGRAGRVRPASVSAGECPHGGPSRSLKATHAAQAAAQEQAKALVGGNAPGTDGGPITIELDATIVIAHSDKEQAAPA